MKILYPFYLLFTGSGGGGGIRWARNSGPELSETLTAVAEDEENAPLVEIKSYFPETWIYIWHLDITE